VLNAREFQFVKQICRQNEVQFVVPSPVRPGSRLPASAFWDRGGRCIFFGGVGGKSGFKGEAKGSLIWNWARMGRLLES